MRAEVENNLVLGLARDQARVRLERDTRYFATVVEGNEIVGCAVRTPPFPLAITRLPDDEAASVLVADVSARYPGLDDVGGPEPSAAQFAAAWAKLYGGDVRQDKRQRLYELRSVAPDVPKPAGQLRAASADDADLLERWVAAFITDTGFGEKNDPAEVVRARLESGRLFVWDDGKPVSMAGWSGKTQNGVRVNLVYTPDEYRRRGYATGSVAALSQQLLENGNSYCCLYTDLANPTSNSIYQRIGYRPVCDVGHYLLS